MVLFLSIRPYELKLTTLSFSRIVIDEIQMYDPELLRYLIAGLKQIISMGGKVAIMTATLPPFIKDLLLENIPFEKENIATFVNDSIRHHLEIRDRKINAEEIEGFYRKNCESGESGKILVVCNTIRKAQSYMKNSKRTWANRMYIFFTVVLYARRERYWKKISWISGKPMTKIERLITDQVSGFQRLLWKPVWILILIIFLQNFMNSARCFKDWPLQPEGVKSTEKPNCFVYTQINAEHLTGTPHGFIDRTLFELSKSALREADGIIIESQKIELINKYFTTENVRASEYMKKYDGNLMD